MKQVDNLFLLQQHKLNRGKFILQGYVNIDISIPDVNE